MKAMVYENIGGVLFGLSVFNLGFSIGIRGLPLDFGHD